MDKSHINRVVFLDILRGIAALSVVFFHYSRECQPNIFYPLFKYGDMGVPLFFIISGFVILMTLEKSKTPKQFIVNRFSRLFPGYWLNIIITFSLIILLGQEIEHRNLKDLLINLTMLQHWLMTPSIDGVYWTLTIELCFYFLMVILFITKQINNIFLWGAIFMILMLFAKVWNESLNLHMYYIMPLLKYGTCFFAGIIFYKIYSNGFKPKVVLLLIFTLAVQYFLDPNILRLIIVCIFYIVFFLMIQLKYDWSRLKSLIFLGSVSYSLYLIHQINGLLIYKRLDYIHSNSIKISLLVLLMIILSYLITNLFEKPVQKIIRDRFNK